MPELPAPLRGPLPPPRAGLTALASCSPGHFALSAGFDAFQLRYYDDRPDARGVSNRRHMEMVLRYCRRFAESFERMLAEL